MVVYLLVQVTLHDSVLTCATMRGTTGKFTIFHSLACRLLLSLHTERPAIGNRYN